MDAAAFAERAEAGMSREKGMSGGSMETREKRHRGKNGVLEVFTDSWQSAAHGDRVGANHPQEQ